MRVLFDVSYARLGPTGTGIYVERLLPELEALGVEVRCVARDRARGHGGAGSVRNAFNELVARPRRGADLLHVPLPEPALGAGLPLVVTVHDLAFELLPDCFDPRWAAWARRTHRLAARRAKAIVTPSEGTRRDIERHWRPSAPVVVAPHGPGQAPPPNRGLCRHFLYVGDDEPRKNLGRLLEAYARYDGPLELVIAGRATVAPQPGVRVEREPDLADLHRHAAALVLPSLHEGFGLTALEAMHAGTPVITSEAVREVCGEAARYVDPRDPQSIAQALTEVATVPPLREELRRRGTVRAQAFSWRRSAEAHLRAYALALRS